MLTAFLACAAIGGVVLVVQLLMAMVGADGGHDVDADPDLAHAMGHGLDLFSVRTLSAGAAFFGLAGAGAMSVGWRPGPAMLVAFLAGVLAMYAVAAAMRAMLRLDDDGSVRAAGAVGLPATVYLTIPAGRAGAGKITLTLQGRTVEYQAVTPGGALPTGASVVVVDLIGSDTVEVVPTPDVGV
jgi:hypothetical protein